MGKKILLLIIWICLSLAVALSSGYSPGYVSDVEDSGLVEPTPIPYKGVPYLTVSQLTLSVVGETEDIYWGTLPREAVIWESANPEIISVEDGIVTANAVGSTTIACIYREQRVECTVACLAQDEAALKSVKEASLRAPKRIPPIVSDEPITFYDESAIIGDSISYIMWQWETKYNYLGNVTFFVRGGTSLNGFVGNFKNLYYRGAEQPLERIIALSGVKTVYLMLGQNDLRYRTLEETMGSWEILTARILAENPNVEICIQSLIPEWLSTYENNSRNEKIVKYNVLLKQFCEENGFTYLDVAPYAVDHIGKMPTSYSLDQSIHLNEEGCYRWMQLLKSYAYLQENKGEN